MNETLLHTSGLAVGFGRTALISGIDLTLEPGECILLCGANGSGKTTLMRTLAGLLRPMAGSLSFAPGLAERTVLIPTRIPKVPGFTLREFIRLSCYRESGWDGRLHASAEAAISQALELLEISALTTSDIATLSDGEFQKGCIATALVRIFARNQEADGLILLDEPTAFLDVEGRTQVLRTLRHLAEQTGTTLIFSSHDLIDSAAVATRILGIAPDHTLLDSAGATPSFEAVLSACFPSWHPAL